MTMAEKYTNRTIFALVNILMPDKIKTLPFCMIANMITSLLSHIPTPSQVIIGVMLRGKKLIWHLNRFGVVCLYEDDFRIFWSAAN